MNWSGSGLALVTALLLLAGCGGTTRTPPDGELPDAGLPDAGVAPSLPPCFEPVLTVVERVRVAPPGIGSLDYEPLEGPALGTLRSSVEAYLGGDAEAAFNAGVHAGYYLCQDAGLVRWTPRRTGVGRAMLFLREEATAPLLLEAPHPFFDLLTLDQVLAGFEGTGIRGLLVSGTHRCASDTLTACDGLTGACGTPSSPYPISDPAHETASAFHSFHQALTEAEPGLFVASLHGFSGAGASVSDGTTGAGVPESFSARVTLALASAFPTEPITTCNAFAGATHEVRLCGTTNVQGRHLNGSPEACGTAANAASGRFLHLEQSRALRDRGDRVIEALVGAL